MNIPLFKHILILAVAIATIPYPGPVHAENGPGQRLENPSRQGVGEQSPRGRGQTQPENPALRTDTERHRPESRAERSRVHDRRANPGQNAPSRSHRAEQGIHQGQRPDNPRRDTSTRSQGIPGRKNSFSDQPGRPDTRQPGNVSPRHASDKPDRKRHEPHNDHERKRHDDRYSREKRVHWEQPKPHHEIRHDRRTDWHRDRRDHSHRVARVFHHLPPRHDIFHHHGKRYHFHHGRYYHLTPQGFVLIRPPRGLIVVNLPIGFRTVISAGLTYYVHGDVYYRRVPAGYEVVQPVRTITREYPEHVAVDIDVLNVRYGPDRDEDVIAQVSKGMILKVLGAEPGWLYVEVQGEEIQGWVMEQYVIGVSEGRG